MNLGQKIKIARKEKKMTGEELGLLVGMTKASLSKIELNQLKGGPSSDVLIRISEALDAPDILLYHCESCPIRQHVMLRVFPELNNVRKDPLAMISTLRREMQEAVTAADDLGVQYSRPNYKDSPEYKATFSRAMEQIIDVERLIEALKFELVLDRIHTQEEIKEVYDRQQRKCIDHGHHKPTGTEDM